MSTQSELYDKGHELLEKYEDLPEDVEEYIKRVTNWFSWEISPERMGR